MTIRILLAAGLLGSSACKRAGPDPVERPEARTDREQHALSAVQLAFLEESSTKADEAPRDFAVQKAAGLAYMRATLAGMLSLQGQAEGYLERAFRLNPADRVLTRSLGRFYNMRAVDGDYSKADLQVEVYTAHLGQQDPRDMNSSDFVAYSFLKLGEILTLKNRGRLLSALGTIKDFELLLLERTRRYPDDIEMFALAGNFAVFFAGNVPMNRERRVRAAVGYFEVLRTRWDELRPGAKNQSHCPNTYENFMFELAEGYTVLEQAEEARLLYEELSRVRGTLTRPKEQIAWVSRERLRNLDAYLGDMNLMPPWPGDVANCVVCHASTADVSMKSLHILEPVEASQIPSQMPGQAL